jgi:hypothetical protein
MGPSFPRTGPWNRRDTDDSGFRFTVRLATRQKIYHPGMMDVNELRTPPERTPEPVSQPPGSPHRCSSRSGRLGTEVDSRVVVFIMPEDGMSHCQPSRPF